MKHMMTNKISRLKVNDALTKDDEDFKGEDIGFFSDLVKKDP